MNFEDQYLVFMKCTGTLDLLSFHENTRTKTCEDCVFSIVLPSTSSVLLLIRKTSLSCWILWLHALVKQSEFSRSVFRVFSVRIFPHSAWIRRDTEIPCISRYSVRMRENTNQKIFEYGRFSYSETWCKFNVN